MRAWELGEVLTGKARRFCRSVSVWCHRTRCEFGQTYGPMLAEAASQVFDFLVSQPLARGIMVLLLGKHGGDVAAGYLKKKKDRYG